MMITQFVPHLDLNHVCFPSLWATSRKYFRGNTTHWKLWAHVSNCVRFPSSLSATSSREFRGNTPHIGNFENMIESVSACVLSICLKVCVHACKSLCVYVFLPFDQFPQDFWGTHRKLKAHAWKILEAIYLILETLSTSLKVLSLEHILEIF